MDSIGSTLIDIHQAYLELESRQADLRQAVQDANGPAWIANVTVPAGKFGKPHRQALDTMLATHNSDDLTTLGNALLYLPPEQAHLVDLVNQAKSEGERSLKNLVTALRKRDGYKGYTLPELARRLDAQRDPTVSKALKATGLSRLNLIWVYRNVRLLPPALKSVSYTYAHGDKTGTIITVDEAITKAEGLQGKARDTALDILSGLDKATKLTVVKRVSRHLKANLVYEEEGSTKRLCITAPAPMLYQDNELPVIKWPSNDEPSKRLSRSDRTIASEPLIKALNIYTYK